MRTIINGKPIPTREKDAVVVNTNVGGSYRVATRRFQPFVWLAATSRDPKRKSLTECSPFPALIDTGTSESLVMHEWHLERWAALNLNELSKAGKPKVLFGEAMPVVKLDLWLFPEEGDNLNQPRDHTVAEKLEISGGSIVSPLYYSRTFKQKPEEARFRFSSFLSRKSPDPREMQEYEEYKKRVKHAADNPRDDIPFDIHPRVPLIGVKLLHSNRLDLEFSPRSARFSIRQQEKAMR